MFSEAKLSVFLIIYRVYNLLERNKFARILLYSVFD